MKGGSTPAVLISESEICARVAEMAGGIAQLDDLPGLAIPVLVGGFVFAADLVRALYAKGLALGVEFLRLRSYANARAAEGAVDVLLLPGQSLAGEHVLLIDGVLDHGRTLKAARDLVFSAGARAATTAVVIDKLRDNALMRADFAAFTGIDRFVVGYGMDDGGRFRSLPYIAVAD